MAMHAALGAIAVDIEWLVGQVRARCMRGAQMQGCWRATPDPAATRLPTFFLRRLFARLCRIRPRSTPRRPVRGSSRSCSSRRASSRCCSCATCSRPPAPPCSWPSAAYVCADCAASCSTLMDGWGAATSWAVLADARERGPRFVDGHDQPDDRRGRVHRQADGSATPPGPRAPCILLGHPGCADGFGLPIDRRTCRNASLSRYVSTRPATVRISLTVRVRASSAGGH